MRTVAPSAWIMFNPAMRLTSTSTSGSSMPWRMSSTSSAPPAYTLAWSPKRASSLAASATVVGCRMRNGRRLANALPPTTGDPDVLAELPHDVGHLALHDELAERGHLAQNLDLGADVEPRLARSKLVQPDG